MEEEEEGERYGIRRKDCDTHRCTLKWCEENCRKRGERAVLLQKERRESLFPPLVNYAITQAGKQGGDSRRENEGRVANFVPAEDDVKCRGSRRGRRCVSGIVVVVVAVAVVVVVVEVEVVECTALRSPACLPARLPACQTKPSQAKPPGLACHSRLSVCLSACLRGFCSPLGSPPAKERRRERSQVLMEKMQDGRGVVRPLLLPDYLGRAMVDLCLHP
ncbi:hypothetical protein AXG93_2490s1540 [Marchantia polymorpha subsp. ruderalis]|uniref:Uncharacterized protein n=1 Tax=Marchantia polymorpha subsp. ruderalis TaxID=1480154 RepID=A0A176W6L5_MARPO|nr:hypothetical protein AXG93_2490s1540 [Marchantia polymorpha subsp. ruderalis]